MELHSDITRIALVGPLHFIGEAFLAHIIAQNSQIQIWVLSSTRGVQLPHSNQVHLLELDNDELTNGNWDQYGWQVVLHFVSKHAENSLGYQKQVWHEKQFLSAFFKDESETDPLKPKYIEVEIDWVFQSEYTDTAPIDFSEPLFLDVYPKRLAVAVNNVLGIGMQQNHWLPLFVTALKEQTPFGMPAEAQVLRDWIGLDDYIRGIVCLMQSGLYEKTYPLVGLNEWNTRDLMLLVGEKFDSELKYKQGSFKQLLQTSRESCRPDYGTTLNGLDFLMERKDWKPASIVDLVQQMIQTNTKTKEQ